MNNPKEETEDLKQEGEESPLPEATGSAIITIKVGRDEYDITSKDVFMDNGACVQLLTQSKRPATWGGRPHPVLPKREVDRIKSLPKTRHDAIRFSL